MSLLWRKKRRKTIQKKTMETQKIIKKTPNPSPMHKMFFSSFYSSIKGVSLPAFFGRRIMASMTVEASIALPLFLLFFLNLSSSLEMIRLHGNLQLALWEVGNRLSVYGFGLERLGNADGQKEQDAEDGDVRDAASILDKLAGVAFSYGYIRGEMVKYAGEDYLDASPINYGGDGLQFLESEIFGNGGCFEIVVTYAVSPWTQLAGFRSFRMANKYYGHIWNGYEIPGGDTQKQEDRETVYVTEYGEVYHEDRDCSYLNISVEEVSLQQACGGKNQSGINYTLCEICGKNEISGMVYITKEGKRFHPDKECAGLKRTVYSMLKITARENYDGCRRCVEGRE